MDPTVKAVLGSWHWRPDVLLVVLALGAGWWRVRRRRPQVPWQLALSLAGLAVIAVALLSPLDALASLLLAAHMIQHSQGHIIYGVIRTSAPGLSRGQKPSFRESP